MVVPPHLKLKQFFKFQPEKLEMLNNENLDNVLKKYSLDAFCHIYNELILVMCYVTTLVYFERKIELFDFPWRYSLGD